MTPREHSNNLSGSDLVRRFSAEFKLALSCARWPLRTVDQTEICRLVREPLNWQLFKRIVERNQVLPLVYHNLLSALPKDYDNEILRSFRATVIGYAAQAMSQAAELVRVTKSIRGAGFEIAALKGISLSVLAFGNLAMRSPGDIDLLVPQASVFEIERVLKGLGYSRVEPRTELTPKRLKHYLRYYKHFTYFSEATATPLELHWRLFHNIPLLRETNVKFPPTMPVEIGTNIVNTLSREELFLYLCVHGAIHGWPILKWLADIRALLGAMDEDNIRNIAELARKRGLMAELRAALTLVDSLLGLDGLPVEFSGEMDSVSKRIVEMSQRLLTAQEYCLDIHRLPRLAMFLYDLRLRSSWRYKSEDIRRALVHPPDWDRLNLPDALFPLYAAIRPVSWLLRHSPRLSRRPSVAVTPPAPFPPDSVVTRRNLDS